MFGLALLVIALVVALGLLTKAVLDWRKPVSSYDVRRYEITALEVAAVSVVMSLLFVPAVLAIGNKLSIDNIVRYEQWVNGVETDYIDSVTTCYEGHAGNSYAAGQSNCSHVWISGWYDWTWTETVQDCTTDSKGNTSCTPRIVVHNEHDPIETPYATREHTYALKASVGYMERDFSYDGVYLDAKPQPFSAKPIRADIPRGAPPDWLEAKHRLDADDPRSITFRDSYNNYILASGDEVLKTYSSQIETYKQAGLLPPLTTAPIADRTRSVTGWQADKVSFVGVSLPDPRVIQAALMRFNAALGLTLQGDLHVVFVDASRIPGVEAVGYTNALKAYWQGPDFEKNALAKNGIVVVIGVSGNRTIEWAHGTTGMPFGNERMLQWLQDYLPGTPLTPESIFGSPRTVIGADNEPVVHHSLSPGIMEKIIFQEAPFKRASMSCTDDGEGCVGYADLLDRIEPTGAQKFWMAFICMLIAMPLWGWAAMSRRLDEFTGNWLSRPPQDPSPDVFYPTGPNSTVERTGAAATFNFPRRKRY